MHEGEGEVTVLVVDDQRPFRAAAAAVLRRAPGFRLVGEAENGEAAVDAVQRLRPDLVVMDITMPGMSGIEATRRVLAVAPGTVVFLCSTYRRDDLPTDAMASGAAAYLHKEDLRPALLAELWTSAAPVTRPAAPSPG
jgi:DNA-binding NarL/FixJ family response regulator